VPLLVYTAIRLALIAVVWAVLWLLSLTGPLWFVVAVVVALLLSYALFRGPRDRAALYLANRAGRRRELGTRISESIDADADAEDAVIDAATEPQHAPRSERSGDDASPGAGAQNDRPSPSSTP
jgi:hypothetical protein